MKNKELLKKIGWTIFILIVMEIGRNIYLPGVNIDNAIALKNNNFAVHFLSASIGGQLTVPTLLSLGLGPYMSAMILWQAFTLLAGRALDRLSAAQMGFAQNCFTLLFAGVQAVELVISMKSMKGVIPPTIYSRYFWIYVVILVAGSMLSSWLANCITDLGVGGATVMILPGFVQNLPASLGSMPGTSANYFLEMPHVIWFALGTLIFIALLIYLNLAEYRIPVERTGIDTKVADSYIPLKLLPSGAMPFMFAMSVFNIPKYFFNADDHPILADLFSFSTIPGIGMYCLIVILLGYGFSFLYFNPVEIARNLQKSGDYIYNITPGVPTEKYITSKFLGMIFINNSFLVLVAATPLLIGLAYPVYANLAFYVGMLMIVVLIFDNIIREFFAYYYKNQYRLF
ncbi:accessory Sec system protein translocase subunit SecY2 [Levilactobacillus bambusae]|uniref:Accessory Sec system protein translocase subunit SecY2 n=1 Tax=Levilactobacillus bambusae TaxID=2024736 RepID=A0A2V1MY06_9LACO|nr:accessory Sec system protein translocase subunit SecY2 [Levilactobacillus bambusae]PWF99711.1 accessory Sec system protein translocase subunit SecY2 [Levilactobacillus bambusae]